MHLRVTFHRVPVTAVGAMRRAHLEALVEPHIPLLEVMAQDADCYAIRGRQGDCGYLLVHGEDTLIEFCLDRAHWVFGEAVVRQALQRLALRRALIQQFDALFLSSCIPLQSSVRSVGLIARDYVPRPLPELPGLGFTSRPARISDLPAIRRIEQDVFTHSERLAEVVASGFMQLYERNGALIGFGILRPVGERGSAVELGIAVDRPYRARGYAVYMLRSMLDDCVARGLRPIGSCAENNRRSRHTAERVGLVSRYRLLELAF